MTNKNEMPDVIYLNDVDGDNVIDNFVWSTKNQMGSKAKYTRADQPQPPVIEGLEKALLNAVKPNYSEENGEWVLWCDGKHHAEAILQAARLYAQGQTAPTSGNQLDPDMPADELRLHMGELSSNEVLVARSAIRWANSQTAQHWRR